MKTKILLIIPILLLSFLQCGNKEEEKESAFIVKQAEQVKEIIIISVYDNYKVKPGLKTAWGFASLIKTPEEQILFDTGGNADILLSNMKKLKIDPESIDKVFISHKHGDHVGGLKGFLEQNNNVTVYIPGSFPNSIKKIIIKQGADYTKISGPQKIAESVYSTGELTGPLTEQSLIIKTRKGIVVITGCAHPGIVRIVGKAKEIMNSDKIFLVSGGFHRPNLSTVRKFRKMKVQKAAPSHCTGDKVRKAFKEEYGEDFIEYGVGKQIIIN
ncbi:MAG: MBL fold metallo-hydrolase [Bacteroidales bacterium]